MTVKTYGAEEVRAKMRDVLDDILTGEAEAIIERNGKPTAVVISYKRWQQLEQEKTQKLTRFTEARARMDAGDYLTLDQAEAQLKRDGLLP
ncbi:MAG: type II toxin-antitoxin system Phd/YefM family antitoxin [Caldilinea sp. CFX5]|nr:type II toxin-antitoxin system Phd/YefM family antitoxin [Caldilinea sp. CFX5]